MMRLKRMTTFQTLSWNDIATVVCMVLMIGICSYEVIQRVYELCSCY